MSTPRWLVVNQSQSPQFQALIGALTTALGPAEYYTGMPHAPVPSSLKLRVGPRYDKRSSVSRLTSWLHFCAGTAALIARTRPIPFLFVNTNPPFLPAVAWVTRRLRGTRYAVLVWDVYPDHLVRSGVCRENGCVAKAWRAAHRRVLLDAEVVITIGESMATALRDQLGPDGDKCRIEVIPNWADVSAIQPMSKDENPFAHEHGQVGKTTIMYSGNLGASHGVGILIDIAEAIAHEPHAELVVIGEGFGRNALATEVRRRSITNLRLVDYQPWDRLRYSLATADIAVVTQAPGTEHLSVPSKTYSALAAGSAILALTSHGSDLARLVREHDVGVVLRHNDVAAVASAILALHRNPAWLARLRANARRAAEDYFSADAAVECYRAVLEPIVTAGDA